MKSDLEDIDQLRFRLLKMPDSDLIEFGHATKVMCRQPDAGSHLTLQLKAIQAEWRRRRPSKVTVTRSELEKHASDASLNHVLRRTVGVINEVREVGTRPDGGRADQEVPGTGCPVLWEGARLIVTARHVIETATVKEIRVAAFSDTAITFKAPEKLSGNDIEEGEPLPENSRIVLCEWEDLAVIVLPSNAFPECDFVDIQREWIDPAEGELVHCCGFPTDHHVTSDRRVIGGKEEIGIAIYPTVFDGKIQPIPSEQDLKYRITDFDPDRHYLIPYACTGSNHPRGVAVPQLGGRTIRKC